MAPPHGEHVEGLVCPVEHGAGPFELLLDPSPAGERPLGHGDGLAVFVVDGVFGEPLPHQVDELSVAEGVLRTRGDLDDVATRGCVWVGAAGGDGADGGDDEVDRDDVDGALGYARELLEEAAGVRDDDRLGHSEAADPARHGLGEGRLDD